MYYRLFHFGVISVYSYGMMVVIGLILGITLAYRRAQQFGENPKNILDLSLCLMVSALIGARIVYVLLHWQYFKNHLIHIFLINQGGLVFYGASIAGIITALFFLKIKQLNIGNYFDICAPSVALGQAFGRIGCFLNGCCFGKIISCPQMQWIGVRFPAVIEKMPSGFPSEIIGSPAYLHHLNKGLIEHSALHSLAVYPTQLFSVFFNLFIFFSIVFLLKKRIFHGQIWLFYIFLYGISRFFIEFLRDDTPRYSAICFTFSQYISLGFIACAIIIYIYLYNRYRRFVQ